MKDPKVFEIIQRHPSPSSTARGSWNIMRQRTDKAEGNAERVANNVMKSINNPILIEDILPVVQDLNLQFGVAMANGLGKRSNPFNDEDLI